MTDHLPDTGQMVPLHPDHLALIQLAQAALQARDNRHLWRYATTQAAEDHAFACAALWDELERQCVIREGTIPVLEHPSVKKRRMLANLRREIVEAAQSAVMDALEDLANGPMLEDEE